MNDLISRKDAIGAFLTELTKRERNNLLHTWSTIEVKYFVVDRLEQLPSAQPTVKAVPVVRASLLNAHPYGECSNCGYLIDSRERFNYCPNCGADMRGEKDG